MYGNQMSCKSTRLYVDKDQSWTLFGTKVYAIPLMMSAAEGG